MTAASTPYGDSHSLWGVWVFGVRFVATLVGLTFMAALDGMVAVQQPD